MNFTGLFGDNNDSRPEIAVWLYTRLKECYELTAESATSEEVRILAQQRLRNLISISEGLPDSTAITYTGITVQSSVSMIREALSNEDDSVPFTNGFPRLSEFNALPDSPVKQYFLALLSLRSDTGNQGCSNALRQLESAMNQEPWNIIYRTLAEAIYDAVD